jgi:hypothetical protein
MELLGPFDGFDETLGLGGGGCESFAERRALALRGLALALRGLALGLHLALPSLGGGRALALSRELVPELALHREARGFEAPRLVL